MDEKRTPRFYNYIIEGVFFNSESTFKSKLSVGCQPCCPKGGPRKATSESQARGAAQGQDSAVQRTAQQNRWGEEALVLQEHSSAPLRVRKMGDRLLLCLLLETHLMVCFRGIADFFCLCYTFT